MLKKFFKLDTYGTSVRTELIAGATTFVTMAYIIFVNPAILGKTGMDHVGLVAATCLASALATIAVGLLANAPIAMAPGMGLNAFFAYSLVLGDKISWQTALGVVFLSGLFFLILTLTGLRQKLVEAIPHDLITAISVGIGLFITFIGLVNLGLIKSQPVTLVTAAAITPQIMIGFAGLTLMLVLEYRKVPGSLLIGIVATTILAALCGKIDIPQKFFSADLNLRSVALKLDIIGALKWSCAAALFSLMFTDMFDSIGTLVACSNRAGRIEKDGAIRDIGRLLTIDAAATMVGALLGTSTTTAYVESAAGIEQGGRSGLTAVVCGLLFIPAIFLAPLIGIVPPFATAPALIMVGMFMVKGVATINFNDISIGFPAFITIVMIPLTYSISTGLAFGFVSLVVLKLFTGNVREIKPAMWLIALLSVAFLARSALSALFGGATL